MFWPKHDEGEFFPIKEFPLKWTQQKDAENQEFYPSYKNLQLAPEF